MEEREIEWLCPNCKKKKKQDDVSKKQTEVKSTSAKKVANVTPTEEHVAQELASPVNEKKVEASKVTFQCGCLCFETKTYNKSYLKLKTKPI